MKLSRFISVFLLIIENVHSTNAKHVYSFSKMIFNNIKSKADYVLDKSGGNTQCAKDLKMLLGDLISAKKWALESK